MADQSSRAVVDASVLLAFLNQEEGRFAKSRELLTDAEAGRLELWAPMVIQVEVARWSKDVDPTDPETRAKLDAFRLLDPPRRHNTALGDTGREEAESRSGAFLDPV